MSPRLYMIFMVVIATLSQVIWRGLGLPDTVLTRTLSASLAIAGCLADRWSTIRMLQLIERANAQGIAHGLYESNPLIGRIQTVRDLANNPIAWALDCGVVMWGAIAPWFGIAVGVGKLYAAWHNTNLRRELIRARVVK